MSDHFLGPREHTLGSLIAEAGALAGARFADRAGLDISMKGPQDYVTDADTAVEALLRRRLAEAFPEDGFLGEEGGRTGGSGALWVVDPIDGTANFARGIPHFCVSVALLADGAVALGAILNPATRELFTARRGRGAWCNGRRMQAASTGALAEAVVECGWSRRTGNDRYIGLIGRVLDAGATIRRSGSGALGLAYVADGRTDAYAELHINSWDCLAALLMVEEAGGRVSPFLDGDGLSAGNPVLAAAPGVAEAVAGLSGIALAPVSTPRS